MVERDDGFRNAGRSVTFAGHASNMPFGGTNELHQGLRKEGAKLRFGRTVGFDK